ncbi:hypothetical protein [Tabrizicola sp.]|uniref:hypothetical protein n=1 Tax=Tabrizicola sp. TaxID=2005166 RepID=UPI003F3310C4
MRQSHHIPPQPTRIEVVAPTLRRKGSRGRWTMASSLTLGLAVLAVILSVTLPAAATDGVCALPLDAPMGKHCE